MNDKLTDKQRKIAQRAFNRVWRHFILEKRKIGEAEYRRNGRRNAAPCAIGLFISNEEYNKGMESSGCVRELVHSEHEFKNKKLLAEAEYFFYALQSAHDQSIGWARERLAASFREVADIYKLKIPRGSEMGLKLWKELDH